MTLRKQHFIWKSNYLIEKKFQFSKKKFNWKNVYKYGEEDVTICSWDIYYRDLDEAQKSSQSIEDQKLHIKKIMVLIMKKKNFEEKMMTDKMKKKLIKMAEMWYTEME